MKNLRELISVLYPITYQVRYLIIIFWGDVVLTFFFQLRDTLVKQMKQKGSDDIDVMKWISRATLEYVGQGTLGHTFDALDDTKTNTYSEMLKMFG